MNTQRGEMTDTRTRLPSFELACPYCRGSLGIVGETARCKECGRGYVRENGIWRFLLSSSENQFEEFLREYRLLREAENWGTSDASYYRSLPQVGANDPQRAIWRIVAKNFKRLLDLLQMLKAQRILDNGAGNGWLSYQLTRRGYTVATLDLADDVRDGLGASIYYEMLLECYQAEFDRLPFRGGQFDVVVFSGSLHYSNDLTKTLEEAARVLRPNGKIIIVATPLFVLQESGGAMIAERERKFGRLFGFEQAAHNIGFLTRPQLEEIARKSGLGDPVWYEDNSWLKRFRRAWIHRKSRREPARFPLIAMEKI